MTEGGGVGCRRGGGHIQDSWFSTDGAIEGELAAVDGGGGAGGEGEGRRRGKLADQPRGFVVQRVRPP